MHSVEDSKWNFWPCQLSIAITSLRGFSLVYLFCLNTVDKDSLWTLPMLILSSQELLRKGLIFCNNVLLQHLTLLQLCWPFLQLVLNRVLVEDAAYTSFSTTVFKFRKICNKRFQFLYLPPPPPLISHIESKEQFILLGNL